MSKYVDETVSAFSIVIKSIASDADRLNSLAAVNANLKDENSAPNAINKLNELDMLMISLEKKAGNLQNILKDEREACKDLEKTRDAALKQREVLQHMQKNLPKGFQAAPKSVNNATSETWGTANSSRLSLATGVGPISDDASTATNVKSSGVSLALVTEEELNSVPKSIRSRLTLSALNDAVSQISGVAENKYGILNQVSKHKKSKKYQKIVIMHRETEVTEHEGRPFVAEQDLRDLCAFFRTGESSARTILSVLRQLRRLKQIQGKNNTVTYCILSPQ